MEIENENKLDDFLFTPAKKWLHHNESEHSMHKWMTKRHYIFVINMLRYVRMDIIAKWYRLL